MFQLRVLSGSKAGAVHQLVPGQVFVVGRGAEANLSVPDDPTLSRNHADIVIEGGQAVLRNRSQHGSLVGGQVVQGTSPIAMGQEFQVGGTRLILEPLPAGAAPAAAGGKPAPQAVGTPVGAASGGAASGSAGGKPDAAAALAAAKNFGGAGGQAKINHTGPGLPFGDLYKGGLSIVKGNLIPSVMAALPYAVLGLLGAVFNFGGTLLAKFMPGALIATLALVIMVLNLVAMLAGPQIMTNYMGAVKEYQDSGKPIGIGAYFSFANIVNRYLTVFLVGVSAMCCFIPVLVTCWAVPIIVANPNIGFVNALKASVAFGKKNIVPTLIFLIIGGVLNGVANMCCGVGSLITIPASWAAFMLAYDLKKEEIRAAAAEAGVAL